MSKVFILGSTGLVGSHLLTQLSEASNVAQLFTVSRRAPKLESPKLVATIEPDSKKWLVPTDKGIDTYISAFGTTRADAGGATQFIEIDHGINYALAKLAKEAGIKRVVLVSSMGANANSWFLYPKTKGQLEKDILDLGFEETIIVRPGMLLGARDKKKPFMNDIGLFLCKTPLSRFLHPIEGSDVAKAIGILLNKDHVTGQSKPVVTIVEPADLIKLAKA